MLTTIDQEFSKQLLTQLYKQTELLKQVKVSDADFNLEARTVAIDDNQINIEVIGTWRKEVFTFQSDLVKDAYNLENSFSCSEIYVDKIGILVLAKTNHDIYYVLEDDGNVVLVAFPYPSKIELPYPRIPIFVSKCMHQYEFEHQDSILHFLQSYNVDYTEAQEQITVSYPVEIPKFLFRKAKTVYRDIIFEFDNKMIKNLFVEQKKGQ